MNVLANAVSLKLGGGLTYLTGLLRALTEVAPRHSYVVCVTAAVREKLEREIPSAALRYETYPFVNTSGPRRAYFDQRVVPRLVRKYSADVLFSATGFATLAPPCPQVLLVHNPIYFTDRYTAMYRQRERGKVTRVLRRWWTLRGMAASDVVLFPTAAMRDMVREYLRAAHPSFEVIHYGHEAGGDPGSAPMHPIVDRMHAWRAEGYCVLLNVSLYSPHKNLETVVEALPDLVARGHRIKLVLTIPPEGSPTEGDFARFIARVEALGLTDTVVRAGTMPHAQALQLYNAADVFAFPSFMESFGYPMVEAMRAGLPSVAAGTDVNREILADSALYFDTRDVQDCARVLDNSLSDASLREKQAQVARQRAAHFDWAVYANRLVQIMESLGSQPEVPERAAWSTSATP